MVEVDMDYDSLIKKAKKYINQGFNTMDGKIDTPSMLDYYLVAATLKAIRFSDSILELCRRDFNNESLPILRSLIEHTINIRWIMTNDTESRLKQYLNDWNKNSYGEGWTNTDLLSRMGEIGFKNRNYYDFVVKYTYSFAHVNARTLDWDKVMNEKRLKNVMSSQAIYSIVAQMLGHVLYALNIKYKGKFDYYRDIWSNIKKSDKDIRKELEKIHSNSQA